MAPRRSADRPSQPWQPAKLQVSGPYKRTQQVWVQDARTGERVRKPKLRWDVRYRVDGHEFRYTLDQKGWADDFAQRLRAAFVAGWLFDPAARRFIDPNVPAGPQLTFIEHASEYTRRRWPAWSPSGRRAAQRDLALACLHLLRKEAPRLDARRRMDAYAYLREGPLMPGGADTAGDHGWATWFDRWSLPLTDVSDQDLQDFIEAVRNRRLDGTSRLLATSSVIRMRTTVKGAFSNALKRRLIDWNPWLGVEPEEDPDGDQVDPDLVMSPPQIRDLAAACAAVDTRYRAYVLTMGLCGPRPGETADVRRRDFDLPARRPGTLTVRSTYAPVPERFLLDGETRHRPLKGRGEKASRTIPMPHELRVVVAEHLEEHVADDPDALVFTTPRGARINARNFHRDVWQTARAAVFADGSSLRRVRRHDLRHSAITAWLNAGVPLKTAQAWSGHKKASVLLDTYLGVMEGDEGVALARYEAALREQQDAKPEDPEAGDSAGRDDA